jgi:hypothetical protein
MDGGLPQHPQDETRRRSRSRRAAWCVGTGVILAIAALICSTTGAVSVQQAIAIGVPGALLIIGGLMAVLLPDAETGQRTGFEVGFRAGSLLTRLQSAFRRRRP